MDYSITYFEQEDYLLLKTRGPVVPSILSKMLDEALNSQYWKKGIRILVDHSDLVVNPDNFFEIQEIAGLKNKVHPLLAGSFMAFVSGELDTNYYYMARWKAMVGNFDGYRCEIFRDVNQAKAWLFECSVTD